MVLVASVETSGSDVVPAGRGRRCLMGESRWWRRGGRGRPAAGEEAQPVGGADFGGESFDERPLPELPTGKRPPEVVVERPTAGGLWRGQRLNGRLRGGAVAGGGRIGAGRGQDAGRCGQLGSGPAGEAPRGGVRYVLLAVVQ